MKRYELVSDESGKCMVEDLDGEYVRYEDAKLFEELYHREKQAKLEAQDALGDALRRTPAPEDGRSIIDPDVIKQARAIVDRYNQLICDLDYSAEFLEREVTFAEPLIRLYDALPQSGEPK